MKREELTELHYITPINNVRSIFEHGILSHNRANALQHESIAMEIIQERRAKASVPRGKRLHEYVNLYIHARNPMMYVRKEQHRDICVLRISTDILDSPGVVVTDSNASSDYVLFAPAPDGLRIVDKSLVFANNWTHPDPIEYFRRKSARSAEVLVPERVDPAFIFGAYVSCPESLSILQNALANNQNEIKPEINGQMFFR